MTEKEVVKIIKKAAKEGRTELDLRNKGLKRLPAEIGQLTKLTELHLSGNQLSELPAEIWQLENLTELSLGGNKLSELPAEIGQLTNLTALYLYGNQLSSLPEIWQLEKLTELYLSGNKLSELPAEIGQLTNLTELYLYGNQLSSLPAEIWQLENLTELSLSGNKLSSLPAEIWQLENLTELSLSGNKLSSLPAEIGQLKNLTVLELPCNQLSSLPVEIGQLEKLTVLDISDNQLSSLPAEIGQLKNLTVLELSGNKLSKLPAEIGQLENLTRLYLSGNQLSSPPAEVVEQGTQAVLAYLKEGLKETKQQWSSKLLMVGEGGVGKTSLLRALKGESFNLGENTTHGLRVEKVEVVHPKEKGVKISLRTWDFGGQQIYHATHQFFLTKRSLFVLVWDARHGWQAGKLYEWLDRIQAKAPESPVMIVATHIDEREADLPLEDLRRKYPQIEGHYEVSNKTKEGLEAFRKALVDVAAGLHFMGESWPGSWLDATNAIRNLTNAIRNRREYYITPNEMYDVMEKHGVSHEDMEVLAVFLHERGDILYFKENENLKNLVILNPTWVTDAISKVLESKDVIGKDGILTRQHRDELWADIEPDVCEHLLWLMEQFDLSYRTLEDKEISLVVERLPLDPPDYKKRWDEIKRKEGCKEISMKFELNSIPAGMPTWFIARSHRFTTHTHWRNGALFKDKEGRHLSLIEAHLYDRYLRLTVRGSAPQNFFMLLRDGLELTLERFPGLKIKRTTPCPGHDGEGCKHEFDFGQLENALNKNKFAFIQCPETFKMVSLSDMLFGINICTKEKTIEKLNELVESVSLVEKKVIPKVFISSTGIDLHDYRDAARSTCIDMEMFPIAMENFEAMGVGATEGSKRKLEEADLYVGIFAHRYGYIEDGYNASVTEIEFDYAGKRGLSRLCFIIDENFAWPPAFIDHENYTRLKEFKKKIDKKLIRGKVTTVENFSRALLLSFMYWKKGKEKDDGYVYSPEGKILERIDKKQDILLEQQGTFITELSNLRELAQRQFLTLFNSQQKLGDSYCPNVFAVLPEKEEQGWMEKVFGQKMILRLFCQAPGCWHPTVEGGRYEIKRPAEWLREMGPYIVKLAKVIKYAAPVAGAAAGLYAGPIGAVMGAEFAKKLAGQIKLMEELAKKLSDEKDLMRIELAEEIGVEGRCRAAEGAELRALRKFLEEADTKQEWGRLKKILTPEGQYLWLCEEHAKEYAN